MKKIIMMLITITIPILTVTAQHSCSGGSGDEFFINSRITRNSSVNPTNRYFIYKMSLTRIFNRSDKNFQYRIKRNTSGIQNYDGSPEYFEGDTVNTAVSRSVKEYDNAPLINPLKLSFDFSGSEDGNTNNFPITLYFGINQIQITVEYWARNVITGDDDLKSSASFSFTLDTRHQRYPFGVIDNAQIQSDFCIHWDGSLNNESLSMNQTASMYPATNLSISSGSSVDIENIFSYTSYPRDYNKFSYPQQIDLKDEGSQNIYTDKFTNLKISGTVTDELKSGTEKSVVGNSYAIEPKEVTFIQKKFLKWNKSNAISYNQTNNLDILRTSFRSSVIGSYKNIWKLTIKNLLEGTTSSGGDFYFKNPTTTNSFDLVSSNTNGFTALSSGFEKSDAFENLNERIGTDTTRHKYSLKAVSSFTDANNITWDWLNGDFNPTTPIDLLLSGDPSTRTKTSTYKGQLVSNTSNWVQTNMVNFKGKESVVYKSMGQLWFHQESGGTREIKVTGKSVVDFSVVKSETPFSFTYIGYHYSDQTYMVRRYNESGTLLDSVNLGNISISFKPELFACWVNSDEVIVGVSYRNGTTVYSKTKWENSAWSGSWSTLTIPSTAINYQVATSGKKSYLIYTDANVLTAHQAVNSSGNPWGSAITVSNNNTSYASSIYYFSGAVNSAGDLNLAYTQRRYNDHNVYHRKVYSNNSMSSETQLETYNSTSYQTTPYYYPQVLTAEGSNLLLEIGKPGYYYNPGYLFWRFDGSVWKKQSWAGSLFAVMNPKKLLQGEADDNPKETTISSLYKFETAAATANGAFNKINEGNRNSGSPYFSIVAQNLTDSNSFYIDLEPSSVDSIVVDTLNIWHIVLKNSSVSGELVTDLNHWGTATYSEPNKTVIFSPDYETRYYYTIDPSSNSARINKTNAENDQEENELVSENSVSVFPNPFNPTTQIKIQIKEKSYVTIEVYNLVGQQVMSEIRNGVSGEIVVPFNGSHLSSGTYFYQVSINEKVFNGKLNLVK